MKAYRLHAFEGPDAIRWEDLPTPEPGPGQIRVRVRATSLNFRDLMISKGIYNPRLKLPLIPLSDGAGEVSAVGTGVTRYRLGDRVVSAFMPGWVDGEPTDTKVRSALGGEVDGMLAEEVVLPETGVLPIPSHLSFEEAATLPCAAVTAWNALFETGSLQPGDSVLVQGTGGVSIFALQFARMAGARVIVTSSSDAKLARVKEMGASDLINYRTTPDWDKPVRQLTGGVGVDAIVEVGGAGTLPLSIRCVKLGGYVALIGVLTGGGEFNPMPVLMRHIRLQGIFVGSVQMFAGMLKAIEVAQMRPVIDRVFPFEQAIDALKHMESGSHFGKVVIRV